MKNNKVKVKNINFTNFVKTRGEIYKIGIERFKEKNPNLNAINYLSDLLFMSSEKLYMVLEGRRDFSIHEEENFLELTNFKNEFPDLLKNYLNHKHKENQND